MQIPRPPLQAHLNRNIANIASLLRTRRDNLDAISVLLTESYFRPQPIILLEYFFYKLCRLFSLERAQFVSLGFAQIQSRYWVQEINLDRVTSITFAYDELVRLWAKNGVLEAPMSKKIAFHVGETRTFYFNVTKICRNFVCALTAAADK